MLDDQEYITPAFGGGVEAGHRVCAEGLPGSRGLCWRSVPMAV